MAGSWDHMTNEDGTPYSEELTDVMDTTGDMAEALWECYGMIWWLARALAGQVYHDEQVEPTRAQVLDVISQAQAEHRDGITAGKTV